MALYVLFGNKNTFLFLYFICLLLNLQMCQIILTDPIYIYILKILQNFWISLVVTFQALCTCNHLFDILWVFHIKYSWLFLVFWPISTMLLFGWSQFVLRFPTLQASSSSLSVPVTIGITVTLTFHCILISPAKS